MEPSIYDKLAAMSDERIKVIWEALAHQTIDYDEPYSTYFHNGVTMGDWVQAVYSEIDRRGMLHFEEATTPEEDTLFLEPDMTLE